MMDENICVISRAIWILCFHEVGHLQQRPKTCYHRIDKASRPE